MSVMVTDLALPLAYFTLQGSFAFRARTTALFGPSGAGKTSLLETIAGLRTPARGTIVINDRVVFGDGIDVPPRDRRIGYVPQDDALFPHLSVRRNILYGGAGPLDFEHVVRVLEIAPLLDRGVRELSGGEKKRVALARALMARAELLLLDEPLSGVDVALRGRVLEYLIRVRDEFPMPMIYVSHDRAELDSICEEVVVLRT
jgi:molybdate transport system ATP-binding protein